MLFYVSSILVGHKEGIKIQNVAQKDKLFHVSPLVLNAFYYTITLWRSYNYKSQEKRHSKGLDSPFGKIIVNKPESEFSPIPRAKSTYSDINTLKTFQMYLFCFDKASLILSPNYQNLSISRNQSNFYKVWTNE